MSNTYNPGSGFKEMSSRYGWRIFEGRPEFHAGQDFSAPEGTPIPSAASGVVVYSGKNPGGFGNLVIVKNDTGSSSAYAHMRGDDQVKPGQRVWPGDPLGRVGNTGKSHGTHLHYSVITEQASKIYDPKHPLAGGPTGLHLDDSSAYDPAIYTNYVLPPPPYLDESQRVAKIGFDGNVGAALAYPQPGDAFHDPFGPSASANGVNPVADRFGKWASAPTANAPAASDGPENFVNRFGKWDLGAPGAFGHVDAPAPQLTPNLGKRSEADDETAPVRVLSSRIVDRSSLAPSDAPALSPASAAPLLGIFSGKPMRDYSVRPSIFATDDRPSPDDDELY